MEISQQRLLIISGAIALITCFFSQGFHHPDEHYSIFELMMWLKTGIMHPDFGWDVQLLIRSTVQPAIYLFFENIFGFISVTNPFYKAFFYRFITFCFSAYSLFLFLNIKEVFNDLKFKVEHAFLFLLSLWFVPYFLARTSSENMSMAFFFLGTSLLFKQKFKFIAGIILALSFATRFQMSIPIAMTFVWIFIFQKDFQFKNLLIAALGVLFGFLLMFILDSYLYQQWTFTPWNYFRENILKSRVNEFGVHPWYFYFTYPIVKGGVILPLAMLASFILYFKKFPKSYLIWIGIPFLLVHNLIGHKEVRFLLFLYVLIAIMAYDLVIRYQVKKNWLILGFVLTLPLYFKSIFTPAYSPMKIYQHIYDHKITEVLTPQYEDRAPLKLMMSYFVLDRFEMTPKNMSEITALSKPYFLLSSTFDEYDTFSKLNCLQLASVYPDWLIQLNPFNFRTRSSLWTLWNCAK